MPKKKKELVATFDGEEDFILGRGVYQSEDFLFLSGNTTQPTTGSVEAVENAINTSPTPAPTPAPTRTPTAQTTTPPNEGTTNLPPSGTIGSGSSGGTTTTTTTAPDIGGSDVGVAVNLPTLLTFDQLAGLTCDRLQARISELNSYADLFGRSQNTIAQGNYANTLAYANQLYQTKCVVSSGGGTAAPTEETTGGGTTGGGTTPPTQETVNDVTTGGSTTGGTTTSPTSTTGGSTTGGTASPPRKNILTPTEETSKAVELETKAPEPLVVTPTPTSPLIIATGFPPSVGTPPPTGKGGFAGGGGGGKSEGGGKKEKNLNWLWILLIAGGVYYLYKRGNK